MLQKTAQQPSTVGGGLNTLPNFFALELNQTPNCMDVKHSIGGIVERRLGSTTLNATALISSTASAFSPDSANLLAQAVTGYWKLDEQAGNRNATVGGHTLTDNNTVAFTGGVIGNAAYFVRANSEYLSRTDQPDLRAASGGFTVACWTALSSKTFDQTIVAKYSASNTANREYRLYYDKTADRFAWALRGATAEIIVLANTLGSPVVNTNYLLYGLWDSANQLAIIQANTLIANSATFGGQPQAGGGEFRVGATETTPVFQIDTGGNLLSGLVAYWPLEEGNGASRQDATGRGNGLSDNNTVATVLGKVDSGGSFIAANSAHLSSADNADLSMGNIDFTIAAWVYLRDTAQSTVIWKGDPNASATVEYALQLDDPTASKKFRFDMGNGAASSVAVSDGTVIALGSWYCVIGWHDSVNDTVNIQVNNNTATSKAYSAGGFDGANPLGLGGRPSPNLGVFLHGTMDEVAIWKKVLTANERQDFYNAGSGNRFQVDYLGGLVDELGYWGKTLSLQNRRDFWNSGNGQSYNVNTGLSGWGSFDFGASSLRWLTVAAGTGIFASSNRGVSFVTIATDRSADYQEFERSKSFLIATSDSQNKVLYWAGSVGTFMAALAPGSAPPVKHSLDFAGYLFLMNDSGGKRTVTYADNTTLLTNTWLNTFTVPSSLDDEITGGIVLNNKAYIFTKYKTFRASLVGGNPDFSVQEVRNWGAVPRTIKKATLRDAGEVILCLSWDKHIRVFDGSEDRIISDLIEKDNGLTGFYLSNLSEPNLHKCHAEVDTEEQVYRIWMVTNPSTETVQSVSLDLRTLAMYPYNNQVFQTAVMAESGNSRILVGVDRGGRVHWVNTSNSDAGTAINEYYDSPFLFAKTPQAVIKSHQLSFYFLPTSSGSVRFQDHAGFSKTFKTRETFALAVDANSAQLVKTVDIPMTQNVYQYRISGSGATTNPWRLTRVDYDLGVMGIGRAP